MLSSERHKRSGIGAPLRRVEDARLLKGQGRFVDDLNPRDVTFAYVVRSPHANARIRAIEVREAATAPGALLVLTGDDARKHKVGALVSRGLPGILAGAPGYLPPRPVLATDVVRHVGDCVAVVVAETLHQAKDAAERLVVDYEPLPAVTLAKALEADAPTVWQEARSNISFALERGDSRAVGRALACAAHITRLSLHYPRIAANPIEPRCAMAHPDANTDRYVLWSSTQRPFQLRAAATESLGIAELDVRVIAPDVGGGFGMKAHVFPEEILVLWAARLLARPVKWTAERTDSFASDVQGRHQMTQAELALDQDGRIRALRVSVALDAGAYLSDTIGSAATNATVSYAGMYLVPLIHATIQAVFTNTPMTGSYRGTGKPEASFIMERLLDKAAHEMGIDRIAIRRRNLISEQAIPLTTQGGQIYDCGQFERVLDKALALADWSGFARRRIASERRGLRRGIGLALHCQRAGSQSERMEIRVAANGSIGLYVGTHSHGQGHETAFAQMVSEWLGVEIDQIRVFQGDTGVIPFGRGTFAQRSMSVGGSALKLAAEQVIDKGKKLAAWMLEVADADIEFSDGHFVVKGTDRMLALAEVARKSYQSPGLPAEFGVGLDGSASHPGPNTYPNGCMICEVEIDAQTGIVSISRLSSVDDVGTVVNPLTLEGQLHGSTVQGIGEALLERILHEPETGQLITGSFTDYAMPRAEDMPGMMSQACPVPTSTNPLGVKGGSEAGNIGAPSAIINAVIDALSPFGVTDVELPATPERIWRAMLAAAALKDALDRGGDKSCGNQR